MEDSNVWFKVGAAGVNPVRLPTFAQVPINYKTGRFPILRVLTVPGTIVELGQKCPPSLKVGSARLLLAVTFWAFSSQNSRVCRPTQYLSLGDALSFEEGACLGVKPYTTGLIVLCWPSQCQAGDKVLVHGCDRCVGIATVQLSVSGRYGCGGQCRHSGRGADFIASTSVTTVIHAQWSRSLGLSNG